MRKRACNVVLALVSLLSGGAVYLIFRPETRLARFIYGLTFMNEARPLSLPDCAFVKYYLVDYLWCLAFCCGFAAVFLPPKNHLTACMAVPLICGVVWELLQYIGAVGGTGDVWDVLMYIFAAATAIFVNIKEKEQ